MVFCCVPGCGTDSGKCDPSVTFHDFPSNPGMATKWITQVNCAIKLTPKWVPVMGSVICSKHFRQTDFKENTDALKPLCVPTIFGHKFIGEDAEWKESGTANECTQSPLIVKVVNPHLEEIHNKNVNRISDVPLRGKNVCEISVASALTTGINISDVSSLTKNLTSCDTSQAKATNVAFNTNKDTFKVQTVYQRYSQNLNVNHLNNSNGIISKPTITIQKKVMAAVSNAHPKKRNISDDSLKTISRKKEKINNDLIEISPNTFLKINPDIIKVNKKLTPSGNTVLQFLMDPKVASMQSSDLLPKIIKGPISNKNENTIVTKSNINSSDIENNQLNQSTETEKSKISVVQHVLGHLVDTHVCADTCSMLNDSDVMDDPINNQNSNNIDMENAKISCKSTADISVKTDSSFLEKAPVLLTTKMPISHCLKDKPKYILQLKQKNRQISSLKFKISNLQKKIEELEDRCIVQERQLSYSFIKRLKTIRKNSAKGDPSATYILEQIRSYTNNSKMRWSDSTLAQCAIWCRKAPYAYEYFKKADFFKLPCLGTVKRFMKKYPDVNALKKIVPNPQVDDESSSDFDFDEDDPDKGLSENDNDESQSSKPNASKDKENQTKADSKDNTVNLDTEDTSSQPSLQINTAETFKNEEPTSASLTSDNSNMEIQEIMLPSGEIVQCYSSNINNSADGQYFIIPNVMDQNSGVDHEYNVVQTDSLPVILQNVDTSQHQEQLIFITNSANQVQCNETIVS